jgi:hypothetical protein
MDTVTAGGGGELEEELLPAPHPMELMRTPAKNQAEILALSIDPTPDC